MRPQSSGLLCLLLAATGACGKSQRAPVAAKAKPVASATQDPWTPCQRAFADAEASFRSKAPGLYEPYRTLNWQGPDDDEDRLAPPELRAFSIIAPGRSWFFMAAASETRVLLETSVPRMGFEPRFGAEWQEQDNESGFAIARAQGERAALVWIDTDRPGQFDVADHPLTIAFLSEFKAAADACLEPASPTSGMNRKAGLFLQR